MSSEVIITENKFALDGGEEGLEKVVLKTAVQVHANAVPNAPADTGALRNSLMWRTSEDEGGYNEQGGVNAEKKLETRPKDNEAVVGTNLDYGVYQEFGTRYMPAQPYLRPAGDAVRGGTAGEIAKKWGREAMKEEFAKRKIVSRRL